VIMPSLGYNEGMTPFVLILWVAAIVCWIIAAVSGWRGAPAPGWGGGLVPLGLALAGSAVVVGALGS
jgi:hypothetical protein